MAVQGDQQGDLCHAAGTTVGDGLLRKRKHALGKSKNAYGNEWRRHFTQKQLKRIDSYAEFEWAQRARRYDLPGPIRVDWT